MKKEITKRKLFKIGFKKTKVSKKESGYKKYYYFTKGKLISSANDENKNGNYSVEFFDFPDFGTITKHSDLKELLKIMKKIKK